MAFSKIQAKVPNGIGRIQISITTNVNPDSTIAQPDVRYEFDIKNAEGKVIDTDYGSLWTHLSAGQKATIINFMDAIRAKAANEAIG